MSDTPTHTSAKTSTDHGSDHGLFLFDEKFDECINQLSAVNLNLSNVHLGSKSEEFKVSKNICNVVNSPSLCRSIKSRVGIDRSALRYIPSQKIIGRGYANKKNGHVRGSVKMNVSNAIMQSSSVRGRVTGRSSMCKDAIEGKIPCKE